MKDLNAKNAVPTLPSAAPGLCMWETGPGVGFLAHETQWPPCPSALPGNFPGVSQAVLPWSAGFGLQWVRSEKETLSVGEAVCGR